MEENAHADDEQDGEQAQQADRMAQQQIEDGIHLSIRAETHFA
jgi:hypothetical protein